MIPLLEAVAENPAAPERLRRYARKLLLAFPGDGQPVAAAKELIEPLSKREMEVLRLIGEGCSNREIAGRLVITVSAVKKHAGNIYGKLNVSSRTQAIARTRQLGLLAADG